MMPEPLQQLEVRMREIEGTVVRAEQEAANIIRRTQAVEQEALRGQAELHQADVLMQEMQTAIAALTAAGPSPPSPTRRASSGIARETDWAAEQVQGSRQRGMAQLELCLLGLQRCC